MSELKKYIRRYSFKALPNTRKYLWDYLLYAEHPKFKVLNKYLRENEIDIPDKHFINFLINYEKKEFYTRLKELDNIFPEQKNPSSNLTFEERAEKEIEAILYKFPGLKKEEVKKAVYESNYLQILNRIMQTNGAYKGGAFVDFKKEEIIFILSNNIEHIKEFLSGYSGNYYPDYYDELPAGIPESDDLFPLDDETQAYLKKINKIFSKLKDNGTFLKVLPVIEKYIKEKSADPDDLSKLVITPDYKIILEDYNQLEIKMSHLTKAVYLLFIQHKDEGIALDKLHLYETELLNLYKEISNRNDYEAMKKSIADLVQPGTNAIHIHLSRIKSAFVKRIHPNLSYYYYITGTKKAPKKIKLPKRLLIDQRLE